MRQLACAVVAVLFVAGGLSAEEKFASKKLIAKWTTKDRKRTMNIEFKEGGKVVVDHDSKKDEKAEGTYKLNGNKLEITLKFNGKDFNIVRTISKLTDDELTSKDEDGKEDTLHRVKGK